MIKEHLFGVLFLYRRFSADTQTAGSGMHNRFAAAVFYDRRWQQVNRNLPERKENEMKKTKHFCIRWFTLAAALMLLLSSCGGGGYSSAEKENSSYAA